MKNILWQAVFLVHVICRYSIVAHKRIGEHQELSPVRRVGQCLHVPDHARLEHCEVGGRKKELAFFVTMPKAGEKDIRGELEQT